MAGPLVPRCVEENGRPWTLKQVQGDETEGRVGNRHICKQHDLILAGATNRIAAVVERWAATTTRAKPPHMVDLLLDAGALLGESPRWSAQEQCLYRSEEHTSDLQSLMRNSYAVFCLHKTKKQH